MAVKQKIFMLVAVLAFVVSFFGTGNPASAVEYGRWNGSSIVYNSDTYVRYGGDRINYSKIGAGACTGTTFVYVNIKSDGVHLLCFNSNDSTKSNNGSFYWLPGAKINGQNLVASDNSAKDFSAVTVIAKSNAACATNPSDPSCSSGDCSGDLYDTNCPTDNSNGSGGSGSNGGNGSNSGNGSGDGSGSNGSSTEPAGETETPEDKKVAQYKKPDTSCKEGETCCGDIKTSIITGDTICKKNADGTIDDTATLYQLLITVLNIMTAAVGIAAVGGIGYGAFLYTTAQNSPEQTKRAIGIITNVVIGIVAYAFMYVLLNFLIPGGVFN